MKLLIIDNYDSFTYNLVHLVEKVSDISYDVIRNDQISIEDVGQYDLIIISPGPGIPSEAGIILDVIKKYASTKKILGVCLGLQAIGEAFGAELINLPQVYHGVATPIDVIANDAIFNSCPKKFLVGRYHSWVVNRSSLPSSLEITAIDEQGNIMAARHKQFDVRGVQFHPESILSEHGEAMMKNWLSN